MSTRVVEPLLKIFEFYKTYLEYHFLHDFSKNQDLIVDKLMEVRLVGHCVENADYWSATDRHDLIR